MIVTRLRLRDFRSYAAADLELGSGVTVLHGRNGAGKTNLLEGLYFGCTGRSCRTSNERELVRFGELMHEHWLYKKQRSQGMSNPEIDAWYELGMKNGAVGGKLIGAGGGGFLMFYTEEKARLRHAMAEAGLREVRFRFDFEGSKVIAQ